jgi:hypothetical protein
MRSLVALEWAEKWVDRVAERGGRQRKSLGLDLNTASTSYFVLLLLICRNYM